MSEDRVEKSAWNLSQHDIFLIGALSRQATSNYLRGNVQEAFFYTEEIRGLIHTDLKNEEDKILDKIEDKVTKYYLLINKYNQKIDSLEEEDEDEEIVIKYKKILKKYRDFHIYYIKRYRKSIREVLGKYGYLFSKKEDRENLGF